MTNYEKIAWIREHKENIIDAYAEAYGGLVDVAIVWDDPDGIHIEQHPDNDSDLTLIYEGRDMDPIYCRVLDNIYDADEWLEYTDHPDEIKTMCIRETDAVDWDDYCETLWEDEGKNPLEIAEDCGNDDAVYEICEKMTNAERHMLDSVSDGIIDYIIEEGFYHD